MTTRGKLKAMLQQPNPSITLTEKDYQRLSRLARAAMNTLPDAGSVLADEVNRAHVLRRGLDPVQTVKMGCEVEFRDDVTGKVQTVELVYPENADISKRKVSVLTPIGTALIGLRSGHSITWKTRSGEGRRLTVLEVREPKPT